MDKRGKLYLLPNRLGEHEINKAFTPWQAEIVESLSQFLVENVKPARQLIRALCAKKDINACTFFEMHELISDSVASSQIIQSMYSGNDLGLISDAGCPGVADPGAAFVSIAHEAGIEVVPLPGPSSILLTLMASGLNGQHFTFHGYLPKEASQRRAVLHSMATGIQRNAQTHLFIETPYRAQHMFDDILLTMPATLKLCLGVDLLTSLQLIDTRTIQNWKNQNISLNKRQVVFAIGK